jgi:pseudaminic acid cytidylyltransferase
MKPIAIIPARAGSKRLPGKNLAKISGIPVLEILLDQLRKSKKFSRVIVSTDSEEIRNLSIKFGAESDKLRPDHLANDHASTQEVIRYEIETSNIKKNSLVFCFNPASILFLPSDIEASLRALQSNPFKFVISVYKPNSSPLRAFRVSESGGLQMLYPEYYNKRSQDLPETFNDAGLFYLAKAGDWLSFDLQFDDLATYVVIPHLRAVDVNYKEDLEMLELLWQHLGKKDKIEIK